MLSLGAGSSCDICYEKFGHDLKAPCSISCGHVFCVDCISHIERLCPLCRIPFDQGSCIKLHLDLDAAPLEKAAGCSPADMKEAQRLQQAIASIADEGTTEARLRQLIQEGRAFLHGQPRNLHKDLRVAHRMIAYLCEIKTNLRSQKQAAEALNGQISSLTTEKEQLLKKLTQSEETRKYERETALAVETSLREHCALAVGSYQGLVEMFNQLVRSTNELVKNAPPAPSSASDDEETSISGSITSTPAHLRTNMLPGLDMKALEGVAVRESESSFLISPLPQFTNVLPSILDGFTPLPELTEDAEGEDENTDEEEEVSTPDSSQNHRPIHGPQELKPSPSIQRSAESSPPHRAGGKVPEPSGLARTAPYLEHRRPRSSSNPSQPTSRSHSPFDRSASNTPPMPPAQHLAAPSHSQSNRYPQTAREAYSSSPRNADGEFLRSRLHDLLRDSPPTSSSLPIMTANHFPASFASRDRDAPAIPDRDSPPPPPSRSSSSNSSKMPVPAVQHSSSDNISHLLASGSRQQPTSKPAPTPSPNPITGPRYSSASAEAKKLEEERRRKYLEEKQQRGERPKEEKYKDERYREERPREERYRESERYREENQGMDYERHPADADRDYRSKTSSRTTNPTTAPNVNQAPRWDQPVPNQNHVYANPLVSNLSAPSGTSSSSLQRGSSISSQTAGTYGRSTAAPPAPIQEHASGHHARHTTSGSSSSKSRPNAAPNPLLTSPAGIYT